jgi:hypothetical protein
MSDNKAQKEQEPPVTKEEILDNAKQLIAGQRAVDYGDAKDNFDRIAAGWNIILARRA